MVAKIFVANDIGSGTRYTIATKGIVQIETGVTVGSVDGNALLGTGEDITVFVKGSVVAATGGIYIDGLAEYAHNSVNISGTGSVLGEYAISLSGSYCEVLNDGTVYASRTAVTLFNGSNGTQSVVHNSGTIKGLVAIDTGYSDGDIVVFNSGVISATITAFQGNAYALDDNSDKIVNSGVIEGNIHLELGNDVYWGGKGQLIGTIFGGAGKDTIKCGDDDDRVHGGSGNDKITGGAGDDIFFFDTSINGSLNIDRIRDFSVKDDAIALDDAVFGLTGAMDLDGQFIANKTGKAVDANDHIIYQTTTGKLFFDVDGKGGADAQLFAILDNNLKLTADHFEIV